MAEKALFVLARNAGDIELVYGSFEGMKVGDTFRRDPLLSGGDPWTVVKVYGERDQRKLAAVRELIGHNALCDLFSTRCASR